MGRKKENPEPKKVKKLPKNPNIGEHYLLNTNKGLIEFEAKKPEGFGKFQIISHRKKE